MVDTVIHDKAGNRQADADQADGSRNGFAIAFQLFAVLHGGRMGRGRDRFRRQLCDEILNSPIRIEPDFLRIGANEGAGENAPGQPRQVAALERLERHHGNTGVVGDLPERDAPLFARFA